MTAKTVEADSVRRHGRPPILRALEYLLYAVLFVVLVAPPAFIYGLIIKDAANFREYEEVQNFYDTPGFSYGAYRVEKDWTAISDYSKIPAGEKFEYTIYGGWHSSTDTYTMMENPAYTFEDGATVALWRRDYDKNLVYVLNNGDFLMCRYEDDYVDDWRSGTYCVLPDEVEKKILDVVKARVPYSVEQSLEWVYAKTKGREPCGNYGLTEQVGYDAGISLATDNYVFVTASNYTVSTAGNTVWLPEAHYIFDRETGERVSIDRFCVGGSFEAIKPELTRRMLEPKDDYFPPLVDYTFTEQDIDTFAGALSPELISFGDEGLRAEVRVKISVYPDEGYVIGARYEALEDLITLEP